jgi:hypothetical protein
MRVYVDGIGLRGPGLADWPNGRAVLAGETPYAPAPVVIAPSPLLAPAERRRMTETVRLAIAVGSEAVAHAGLRAEDLPSVFSSSGGDGATITAILDVLASPQREVSPTRFHNSVHNAPAGYWSIATQSRETSTSLCAHDFSFGTGLLEAAGVAASDGRPVLLVAYDLPYPAALDAARPIGSIFGVALVLRPDPGERSIAALDIALSHGSAPETPASEPAFERLRTGNPAARALPLLVGLAQGTGGRFVIHHMAGNLIRIDVTPPAARRAA